MAEMIYYLVDANGEVYSKDGALSHADVAPGFGLNEERCDAYRFDVVSRRLVQDRGTPASEIQVRRYLADRVGTIDRFIRFAEEGHLPKDVLVTVLDAGSRRPYLDACTDVERHYTVECGAKNDPCLESGCSIDHEAGETCLQPLLNAGIDYYKACAAEWIKLFQSPQNRIEAWRSN